MGFGLLFVPLMGGYLFLTSCNSTRFLVRRQSGHHLLFRSASVGLVLLAVARVLEVVAGRPGNVAARSGGVANGTPVRRVHALGLTR